MLIARLQQISGILIVLLILLDVFLTVLYARMGSGLLSPLLARTIWRAFVMRQPMEQDDGDELSDKRMKLPTAS